MKIAELLQKRTTPFYSLEFFPPKDPALWADFFSVARRLKVMNPLFVSVTYGAGGSSQDATLEITTKLKQQEGFEPMAHLTCVGASEEKIGHFLEQLSQAGIDNILALRGDLPKGQAQWPADACFRYAEDLVCFVRKACPSMGVGVAGYPAPHPESTSFASDRAYLQKKIAAGADFVTTQLFFDCREYFEMVAQLKAVGIHTPVIPGVLPIQSLESIRRTLAMCGANIPGSLYLRLEEAHNKGGVEAVKEAGVAFAVEQVRRLLDGGAPGVHLYTLNRADLCLRIMDEVGKL